MYSLANIHIDSTYYYKYQIKNISTLSTKKQEIID
jgi:hypothetical protein